MSPSSPAQMPSPSPQKLMPVVQPDGVVGGQNVVKSKGVGGVTRQARTGSTPFTEEPLSSIRRTIAKRLSEAKVCVCMHVCCNCMYVVCFVLCVCVCVCVCVHVCAYACVCICVSGCACVLSVRCVFCVCV